MANFDDLPVEVILEIAKNLSVEDAMRLASTSRRLRGIILNDAELWEHFTQRDWGIKISHEGDANKARTYYRLVFLKKPINTLIPFLERHELRFIQDLQDYPANALKSLKAFSQSSPTGQTIDENTLKRANEHLNTIIGFLGKPTTCNTDQRTPLYTAALHGYLDLVKALLAYPGIDVNQTDSGGTTPLYWAAFHGHLNIVKALLACPGIEINKANNMGYTPLHWAAFRGHLDIVQALLACPCVNVNKADNEGYTPLFWAERYHYTEISETIRAHIKSQDEAKASAKVVSQLVMHYFAQKPVAEVNDNQDAQKEGMKERLYGQYGNHK